MKVRRAAEMQGRRVVLAMLALMVALPSCRSDGGRSGEGPTVIKIYRSDESNIQTDCEAVVAEDWQVADTSGIDLPTAAVRKAIDGVIPSKRLHRPGTGPLPDYFRGVRVEGGVAILMFDEGALEYLNNAACAQMAVKAPILRTLMQFSGVSSVEYEIDGVIFRDWDA
jgi:hypothetical protein